MNERYSSEQNESPRSAVKDVIKESIEAQKWLKRSVQEENLKTLEDNILKKACRRINLHYNPTNILENWNNIIKRLTEKFKDDDSVEGILFNNPQVKKLLSNIVSFQAKDIKKDKSIYERNLSKSKKAEASQEPSKNKDSNQSENLDGNEIPIQDEPVESWEDYKYNHSSLESFENFILSDEWIAVIVNEVKRHINRETGEIYSNYEISEEILKLRLKNAWDNKLRREYNEKIGDPTSDEEKDKFDRLWNIFEDGIDNIVWEYIKSWGERFDKNLIDSIEYLLVEKWDKESLNKDNDVFKETLRGKIKNFASIVLKGKTFSLNTWNKQVNLQLRSYLFMYGKIFYPDLFKTNQWEQYYEDIFPKIMLAILENDGYEELENIIKKNEFLEQEKRAEEARKKRDEQKRLEIARRNRERNSNYSPSWWINPKNHDGSSLWNSWDLQNASWAQIAEISNLNLWDFKVNGGISESISKNEFARNRAFWIAWKKFINSHSKIAEIITDKEMRRLYNTETNIIDENARKEFLKSDIMKWKSKEEIDSIHKILSTFSNEFNDALEQIASQASTIEWKTNEKIRNYAIWSVIDNVRLIFSNIVEKWKWDSKFEWFKFNSNPVKREWNDIIISGTFNWADIKIRYDLISGALFMNSFFQYLPPSKITIWNNDNANFQIWQLESFDTILDEHYRTPGISSNKDHQIQGRWNQFSTDRVEWWNSWNTSEKVDSEKEILFSAQPFIENHAIAGQSSYSEPAHNAPRLTSSQQWSISKDEENLGLIKSKYRDMLDKNLDMISDKIIDNTKKQSAINSVITKFMKTFNIIRDGQENKSIEFSGWWSWSDLFDFLEIISNSNPDTLDKFLLFMKEVAERSWLNRWNNNILWPQMNLKSMDTFNEDNKNENISLLRECRKDFSAKYKSMEWKLHFETGYKFWFAQIIKEKLVADNTNKPNRKLDERKMHDFFIDAWLNPPF